MIGPQTGLEHLRRLVASGQMSHEAAIAQLERMTGQMQYGPPGANQGGRNYGQPELHGGGRNYGQPPLQYPGPTGPAAGWGESPMGYGQMLLHLMHGATQPAGQESYQQGMALGKRFSGR